MMPSPGPPQGYTLGAARDSLNEALRSAQQQNALLQNAVKNADVSVLSSTTTTAYEQRKQQWGDKDSVLDSLLNDVVAKSKMEPPKKPPPKATPQEAEGGWQIVSPSSTGQPATLGQAQPTQPTGSTGGESQGGEVQEQQEPHPGYYTCDDDVYVAEDGEEMGDCEDGEEAEGDGTGLREVLELRSQLHDLDSENARLRQQLEQHKALMVQLQQSLLLNAPHPEAAPAGPTEAETVETADQGFDALAARPSASDTGAAATRSAPAPTAGTTGSAPTLTVPPSAGTTGNTTRAAGTPVGGQPAAGTTGSARPSPQPYNPPWAPQPLPAVPSPNNTSVVPTTTYILDPSIDILDGLGLSNPSSARTSAQPPAAGAAAAAAAARAQPQQLARQDSDGAVAAVMAVEEYERSQQAAANAAAAAAAQAGYRAAPPLPVQVPAPMSYAGTGYPTAPAACSAGATGYTGMAYGTPPAYPVPGYTQPYPYSAAGMSPGAPYTPQPYPHPYPAAATGTPPPPRPPPWSPAPAPAPPGPHVGAYPYPGAAPPVGYAPAGTASGPLGAAPPPAVPVPARSISAVQQRPATMPSAASTGDDVPWACAVCTYMHEGPQVRFLRCAICNALR